MTRLPAMTATCLCGSVELKAFGKPIVRSICYCRDCQDGARQIEALPGARPVSDPDGGTGYMLYRSDRFECVKGADYLKGYKLRKSSPTNRIVAVCCNTGVFVNFDKGPFWVSAYTARFKGDLPPLEFRVCTKTKPAGTVLPDDVPNHRTYSAGLIFRLLAARFAMLLGR